MHRTMVYLRSLALSTLALASAASAACSYSTAGHWWDLQIFSENNCGTGGHHEEFYGHIATGACYNVASVLNDNVHSFVWTRSSSSTAGVQFYKDANCVNPIGKLNGFNRQQIRLLTLKLFFIQPWARLALASFNLPRPVVLERSPHSASAKN